MGVQGSALSPAQKRAQGQHQGTLFARARAYAPLTPGERALLRLIEGLACAALVAALPIVAGALGRGSVRWDDVARAALAAAGVAVLLALAKYARAQGDPALGTAIAAAATAIAGTDTLAPSRGTSDSEQALDTAARSSERPAAMVQSATSTVSGKAEPQE